MKKFVLKTLLFTALLIIGAYAMDYMVGKGLRKTGDDEYQTWNDIFNSQINADIIIQGSSRAALHFDPKIIDSILNVNSYNLGINGHFFNMQYVRFKNFEKYNRKPALIIQNIEQNIDNSNFKFHYLYTNDIKQELRKANIYSGIEVYVPAIQYYSQYLTIEIGLLEFFNIRHYGCSKYKGYEGMMEEWNSSKLENVLAGDSIITMIDPKMVTLFNSFLNHCKQNDIEVVLVYAPQYYRATEFTKDREKLMNIYRSFSKQYNFPFLDYSADPLCYDTAYFYNAMHLNKTGAEIFSKKLAHDIDSLGILK